MNPTTFGCLTVCTVLSLSAIASRPATAAVLDWSLIFTDSQGVEIGTGGFSYDTDQVVVVRSPGFYADAYVAGSNDPLRADFIPSLPGLFEVTKKPNPLVSFMANLPDRNWSFADIPRGLAWWNPTATGALENFGCTRTTCGVAGQWFAGSPFGNAPGQFAMFGGTAQPDGTYIGSFVSAFTSGPGPISGTWTAQAVPEPTTITGAVVVGIGYFVAKAKRSRH